MNKFSCKKSSNIHKYSLSKPKHTLKYKLLYASHTVATMVETLYSTHLIEVSYQRVRKASVENLKALVQMKEHQNKQLVS